MNITNTGKLPHYAATVLGLRLFAALCGISSLYSLYANEPRHEKTCLRGLRPGKTQPACSTKKQARVLKFWI